MCFSAKASFLASGVLFIIGVATLRKARRFKHPEIIGSITEDGKTYTSSNYFTLIPLALIPLLFSIQQFAEGISWVYLPQANFPHLASLGRDVFLFFALMVWPLLIPFSALSIETSNKRRKYMAVLFLMGAFWFFVSKDVISSMNSSIDTCHIVYYLDKLRVDSFSSQLMNINHTYLILLYCIPSLIPLLISTRVSIKIVGLLMAVAAAVTYFVWYNYFLSIWCFFAALISVSIYKIVNDYVREYQQP